MPDRTKGRILFIEDDPLILETTTLALEREGYTVLPAVDGESGLSLLASEAPDLVLLDIMLPGMDGFDVCRTIRERSDVPVVMVTARSDTVDVVVGLEVGADDYVAKPFETRELLARIKACLRRARGSSTTERIVLDDLEVLPGSGWSASVAKNSR